MKPIRQAIFNVQKEMRLNGDSKELEYVLRFALDVIEENELENTKNSDNWTLGEAIEEQLSLFGVTGSLKVDTREFSNISMMLLESCNDLTEKTNRAIEINKYITIVDDPKD